MSSTLFFNGKILSMAGSVQPGTAVLVENGIITGIALEKDLKPKTTNLTRFIDLGKRTLMPGFIDTHGHVALFGLDELKVKLEGANSKQKILARLKKAVNIAPPLEWIISMPIGDPPYFLNAETLYHNGEIPSLNELDSIAPNNPIYIQAPTNRVPNFAVLNSAAMRKVGITRNDSSSHSKVVLDDLGEPTGVLRGALQPIYNNDPLYQSLDKVVPKPSYTDIRKGIEILAPIFSKNGTTSLLEAHLTNPEELRAYVELERKGKLPTRIFYTFEIDSRKSLNEISEYLQIVSFSTNGGFGTPKIKICGVSIGLDGPYWHGAAHHDGPYLGPFGKDVNPPPLVSREKYEAIVEMAASMGFRIFAEAAGRGSIGIALEAFKKVNNTFPIKNSRHVLEHCEFPTEDQIDTCAKLGIAPTTSTNFIWGKGEEVYNQRLGSDIAGEAIPLRSWLDKDVPISQSTDWGPHNPFFTVWESIVRHAGLTGETIGSNQSISREEALRIFTYNGAWVLGLEKEIGTIEIGKQADLIIVKGDPLTCDLKDLKMLKVDLTMVAGNIVHFNKPT